MSVPPFTNSPAVVRPAPSSNVAVAASNANVPAPAIVPPKSPPPVNTSGLAVVVSARGAAFGENRFNDGHIDVVLNSIDGPPVLLRNVVKNANHWLTLKLVGGPKSPRDAIGTKVFVTTGNVRQRADVFSGGSYASSSDPRVHFGPPRRRR